MENKGIKKCIKFTSKFKHQSTFFSLIQVCQLEALKIYILISEILKVGEQLI